MFRINLWLQNRARCILTFILMIIASTSIDSSAGSKKIIWQSREQYVALEPQYKNENNQKPAPNSHPFNLEEEQLRVMLSGIATRITSAEAISAVFTSESLNALVPQLKNALKQASPNEDITFAVIGLHRSFIGFAKSPKVTAGRLFVQDGKLNIIFGQLQKDVNEKVDRRLDPFTPGERAAAIPAEWEILPPKELPTELFRRDWVVFGKQWNKPSQPGDTSAVPNKSIKPSDATLQNVKEGILPKQNIDYRGIAERLIILNELRDKRLISDEEYKSKRLGILNEL